MISIFSPALNVFSRILPFSRFLIFTFTNAPPLPGLTCWNHTILHGFPLKSIHKPFLKSAVVAIFLFIFAANIRQLSECSAVGSALRSGRRGRAFESPHSDKTLVNFFAQKKNSATFALPNQTNGVIAQLVEQRTENPCVPGSIPGDTTSKEAL